MIIGDNPMFSWDISMQTGDGHFIFDRKSEKRASIGKSIFIGDRVWSDRNNIFMKGAKVFSGAVLGLILL
ncbi:MULTISPECIES: hypothetical protein [unclassified Campylobacter]|uniref:hypothetical protein n=1 Tax=unclassified Campylobacter TaxID=2593542 RepID=UPI001238387D|nr:MULTISPECIES: hypothetical protein [unclassified Campylobacter]KAA6225538.1 hypothetical protein FMM55_06960 [Campylobacter sp. LR196d]KAA6229809.1 hypothetical protein FMM57_00630 [Campylobacter sp. LR286c]